MVHAHTIATRIFSFPSGDEAYCVHDTVVLLMIDQGVVSYVYA